jgi:hypothetical protein
MSSQAGEEAVGSASASSEDELPRPAVERSNAERVMVEALKSYELAELVHQRSSVGSIDSAPLAYKALVLQLELLLQLHGVEPPKEPEELLRRATSLMEKRGLATAGLAEELALVLQMRTSFLEAGRAPSIAEGRRYDRAFLRLREVFDGLESELDGLMPSQQRGLLRYLRSGALLAAGFLLGMGAGWVLGRSSVPEHTAQQQLQAAPAAVASADNTPAFSATFYRDQEFREVAFTRKDKTLALDWAEGAPPGLDQSDHFSVRWTGRLHVPENGEFDFFLTSDDGSRLFIDDKLVLDNWGQHTAVSKEGRIPLSAGAHPIRLEYFDSLGQAMVRLEWSSDRFPRRVVSSSDLR